MNTAAPLLIQLAKNAKILLFLEVKHKFKNLYRIANAIC